MSNDDVPPFIQVTDLDNRSTTPVIPNESPTSSNEEKTDDARSDQRMLPTPNDSIVDEPSADDRLNETTLEESNTENITDLNITPKSPLEHNNDVSDESEDEGKSYPQQDIELHETTKIQTVEENTKPQDNSQFQAVPVSKPIIKQKVNLEVDYDELRQLSIYLASLLAVAAVSLCLFLCVGSFFTLIGIIADSVNHVNYNELGVAHSKYNKRMHHRVYQPGRYFLGPGWRFIKFPKFAQTIQFSNTRVRSNDGLVISIDVSFQYMLNETALLPLLLKFGPDGYLNFARSQSVEIIRDISSNYSAYDFFSLRSVIADQYYTRLKHELKENVGAVDVLALQLQFIDLPDGFENEISQTEVIHQTVLLNRILQTKSEATAGIAVDLRANRELVKTIEQEAKSKSTQIISFAQKTAIETVQNMDATAYDNLGNALQLNNQQVLTYKYIMDVKEHGSDRLFVNMNSPFIISNTKLQQESLVARTLQRREAELRETLETISKNQL